ncbi:MAG: hypothetical protein K2W82_19665 [Candidatus Obscuribacterales bacterium]|nr:hypothetical protein [Candidatus Obscuribacterales bacterium]
MILEAFATYLQAADPKVPAKEVLTRWLWERLTLPAQNNVDRVVRSELTVVRDSDSTEYSNQAHYYFNPISDSGRRLLATLYEYSMSYEQQKWSRWVHSLKASDFNPEPGKNKS